MLRVVLVAWMLALVSARQNNLITEGSADWEDTLKGDLDDIDVEESEGSGEEEEVVQMIPDKVEEEIEALDKDFHFKEKDDDPLYDYYDDVKNKDDYDYVEYDYNEDDDYDEYEEDEYDYLKGKKGGIDQESVLILDRPTRPTQRPNIEIKPKKPLDKNNSLFETSHILIMAGSALVSFGLVMFAFFMCRRAMDNKKQKATAFVLPPPRTTKATSPIVKNYQRVPTTTKEFLQCRENTHIDMYRGDGVCDQKPTAPPAVYDPLLTKY